MTTGGVVADDVVAPGAELVPGYVVVGLLNRGAELDVYDLFSAERACRTIAKLPRGDVEPSDAAVARLRREGRLLTRLAHPHLVRGYEILERDGHPVLITETIGGATLSYLLRVERIRLTAPELAELGLQLASVLHYLHGRGWLHLDLKPSNVIDERGHVKVLDLNLARRPGRVPRGWGTAHYQSPEQVAGTRVGTEADVWGLGATLWAAATAERPFDASGHEQAARRAQRVGEVRRLPRAFSRIVDACLEPDPADRPTLGEVRAALEPPAT